MEQRVGQESACLQRLHATRPRSGSVDNICERIENLRSEMTELVWAFEIFKALAVALALTLDVSQVPADSQPCSVHEAAKQGELSEVSDVSDVSILHGAPEDDNESRVKCLPQADRF